jgi:hypothetical protein
MGRRSQALPALRCPRAMRRLTLALVAVVGCVEIPAGDAPRFVEARPAPLPDPAYTRVVERVAAMVADDDLAMRVARRGLSLVNVTWEDTGRAWGSALGPNITDFTLQVRHSFDDPGTIEPWFADHDLGPPTRWESTLMPVLRPPNFADVTGDVPSDRFFVRVGNGRGNALTTVPLLELIRNLGWGSSSPELQHVDLSAPRDTHFLVSAQALFLPIPRLATSEFNPVLFNYQSAPGSPAVLAILATREGTSLSVIENRPEDLGAHWGQELYFNDAGKRAYFTAGRRSDVVARIAARGGPRDEAERSMLGRGADVMALIQVPLRHDDRGFLGGLPSYANGDTYGYQFSDDPLSAGGFGPNDSTIRVRPGRSEALERAVLGHGAVLGPFVESHGTKLVRDDRFPVRITVQFYKATSTGDVSDSDLDAISRSIASAYAHADYVGSLVVPADDARRPTAWQHVPDEWFPW